MGVWDLEPPEFVGLGAPLELVLGPKGTFVVEEFDEEPPLEGAGKSTGY